MEKRKQKILLIWLLILFLGTIIFSISFASKNDKVFAQDSKISISTFSETFTGDFEQSSLGGGLGLDGVNFTKEILIDDIQQIVYIKLETGYELGGIYSTYVNGVFGGKEFSASFATNGLYELDLSSAQLESENLYVKLNLKRIHISFEPNENFSLIGAGTYVYGSSVTVRATARTSTALFSKWTSVQSGSENVVSTSQTYIFTATSDVRLKVVPKYYVDIVQSDFGDINILHNGFETSERYFEPNVEIKIEAIAHKGYKFVNFEGEFADSGESFKVTITKSIVLQPIFESKSTKITISASDDKHSSLEGSTTTENINFFIGDEIILKVEPSLLFKFTDWTTNASGSFDVSKKEQKYIITADDVEKENITFVANIIKEYAYTSITIYGSGSAFINDINTTKGITENKLLGEEYSIILAPNNMYELTKLEYKNIETGNVVSLLDTLNENSLSIEIVEDFELEITFSQIVWTDYKVEPEGSGTKTDPYKISSPEQFAFICYAVKNNITPAELDKVEYKSAYYLLEKNIDFAGKYWETIGVEFSGTLDVNFKTIKNVTLTNGTVTSNFNDLFAGELHMTRDINTVWRISGILISFVLAIIITFLIIAMSRYKEKPKKVVIYPIDIDLKNKK